jgi:heme o synthase
MTGSYLFILLKAGRWQLSAAAALATVCGALLARPAADIRLVGIFTGAALFALAVTWFNQIQERQPDSHMTRTKNRPLANNTLPVRYAIAWAGLCLAASIPLLFACGGWSAIAVLGFVIIFYNGIYTPMKRRSLLALIPGAIAGAAPPVLGWVCEGGAILKAMPLTLFLLFFIWQVPHFWLTAQRNRIDYENSGFPLPWRSFGNKFYIQILSLWVIAFSVVLLALPAFGFVRSATAQLTIIFMSVVPMAGLAFHVLMHPVPARPEEAVETLRFAQGDNICACHSERSEESLAITFSSNSHFCAAVFEKNSCLLVHLINFSMAAVCAVLVAEKISGG